MHFVGERNIAYTCEFIGTPTPTLVFYFNGDQVSPDESISITGNTLMIISPHVNHSGIYQCIVSNEYGDDQLAWMLEIREPCELLFLKFNYDVCHIPIVMLVYYDYAMLCDRQMF